MNTNMEIEYKVLLTKEQFNILCSNQDTLHFIRQINTYYDTVDFQIRKQKGSMRIREKQGKFLFTLKLHVNGGLMEYEKEVDRNDVSVFKDCEISSLLSQFHLTDNIQLITSLTTDRAVVDTGNAELCFDHNFYNGKEDYEIEYEYKMDHDGLSAFQKILDPLQITYIKNCTSKSKRAISSI